MPGGYERKRNTMQAVHETARGRQGLSWTTDEEARLAAAHRGGASVAALALAHGRTTAAIEHRLVERGLMRADECQYGGAPIDRRPRERMWNESTPRMASYLPPSRGGRG